MPLTFYKKDKIVGRLSSHNGSYSFIYDDSWAGGPISSLLPLDGSASPQAVFSWFENMLPEANRKFVFEKMRKFPLKDIENFLALHGEDLPGDLSVRPSGIAEKSVEITRDLEEIIEMGFSLDVASSRLSLAGAEPKIGVVAKLDNGRFKYFGASANSPSTHILKFSQVLTPMELVSMSFVENLGLFPVAHAEIAPIAGKPALLVKRFDRKTLPDGSISRLAQEDFCQSLGAGSDLKYGFARRGVESSDMARAMRGRLPEADVKRFMLMNLANFVIGNSDDHAKNFAMVNDGGWRLAPAYDIVSASAIKALAKKKKTRLLDFFANLDTRHARMFGRERDPYRIGPKDIALASETFAIQVDWLARNMNAVIDCALDRLPAWQKLERNRWENVKVSASSRMFAFKCLDSFARTMERRCLSLRPLWQNAIAKLASRKTARKHVRMR